MAAWNNVKLINVIRGGVGSFLGIGLVALLAVITNTPLIIASFGASAVIIFGIKDSPLAKTKNVVGGHLLSAAIGIIIVNTLGNNWFTTALAVGLAISLMIATGTIHPPGGATAVIAVWTQQSFSFLVTPILVGLCMLILVGKLVNYLFSESMFMSVKKFVGEDVTSESYHHRA